MEDREHVRAVFSTANGKYGYREARRWVRPIFREDFCFKDDVEDLSQRLQQEFPKQCKLMTAADARHVETYFDPVDVQMQSHVFLHEVLMRIVFCNFEEARGRVQEYVNRVFLDPIRYERLKVEDLEIHVFSKEEQDLVGYDNTLPAALAILKQYKFPQAFGEVAGYRPAPQQRMTVPSAAVTGQGITAPADSSAAKSTQAPFDHPYQINAAVAPLVELEPQTTDSQNPNHAEPCRKSSKNVASQMLHPSNRLSAIHTIFPGVSLSCGTDLLDNHVVLREGQPSIPLPQSVSNSWQDDYRTCNGELVRHSSGPRDPAGLSSHSQQISKNSKPLRGTQNPIKKISDDIRRQSTGTNAERYQMHLNQADCVHPVPTPNQFPFMQYPSHLLQVPNRTSSIGFRAPSGSGGRKRSAIDVLVRSNVTGLVPFYPRPETWHSRPELDVSLPQHAKQLGEASQPRILSNPFPSTIFEDPEHEGQGANCDPSLQFHGRRGLDQDPCDRVKAPRASKPNDAFEKALSNHVDDHTQRVRGSSSPGTRDRRPSNYQRSLECSTKNLWIAHSSPRLPLIQMDRMNPNDFSRVNQGSAPLIHKENASFPLRQNYGQTQAQNEQSRCQGSDSPLPRNQYHRRSSFHQEQLQAQRPLPPSDDCALFVSGLPSHFEAKTLWDMLGPIRGLKWVASPRKTVTGKASCFSKVVFHEPLFATEALELLPKTHFSAMNGKFLDVRRFDSDRTRRSSEPAKSKSNRPMIVESIPRHSNHLSISIPSRPVQEPHDIGRNAMADNGAEGHIDQLGTPRAETPSNESLHDGSRVGPVKGFSVSTGSPVKRKKWKRLSAPKSPERKPQSATTLSQTPLADYEVRTLECELRDLALEAAEAATGHALKNKQSTGGKLIESFERNNKDSSASSAMAQPQPIKNAQVPKVERKAPLEDEIVDDLTRRRSSSMPSTVRSPQTKRPLEAASGEGTTSVHLPRSSDAPEKPDVQSMEAVSLVPTQSTTTRSELGIIPQDHMIEQGGIRQVTAAAEPHNLPAETMEQQRVAEASQRHFAADFVQKRSKLSNSKQEGKGRPFRASLKATGQHSNLEVQTGRKPIETKKAGNQPEEENAEMAEHPAGQYPHGQSLITSRNETQQQSASGPMSCKDVCTERLSIYSCTDYPPLPVTTSSSTRGAKCVILVPSTTAPGSAHPTERAKTPEENCSKAEDADPKGHKNGMKSSLAHVDPAYLQGKLKVASSHGTSGSRCNEIIDGQDNLVTMVDKSKKLLELNARVKYEGEKRVLTKSKDTPEKLPSTEQQKYSSMAPRTEAQRVDESNTKSSLDPEDIQAEKTVQPVNISWVHSEKQEGLEDGLLRKATVVAIQGSSCQSPTRLERLAVPPRSSSIARTPTPAPIMTRKKKQKRFTQVVREQEDMAVIWPSEPGTTKEGSQEYVHMITDEENETEKETTFNGASLITEPIEITSRDKSDIVHASRSDSAQSQRFLTPPTTPCPEESSSPELSPMTPLALTSDHSETPRQVSNAKPRKNRKKNRPGKKKPKSAVQSPINLNALSSTVVDEKAHTLTSAFPVTGHSLSNVSEKNAPHPQDSRDAAPSTTTRSKGQDACAEKVRGSINLPNLRIQGNLITAGDEVDASHGSSTPGSEEISFAEVARESGYTEIVNGQSFEVVGKPALALIACDSTSSVAARELRSRSYRAAMTRIQDLCVLGEQAQHSLHSTKLSFGTNQSRPQSHRNFVERGIHNKGWGDLFENSARHVCYNMKQQMNVQREVAALDQELQSIIREAVQMAFPFASDDDDKKKGELHTLKSMRAQRILKVASFRETFPLVSDCDGDTKWMTEWCEKVDTWIRNEIPRLNEEQQSRMYEWERQHPSLEKNLAALGFTELEIEQLGLTIDWRLTRYSPARLSSMSRQSSVSSDLDDADPSHAFSKLCEKPDTKNTFAEGSINAGSGAEQAAFEDVKGANSRVQDIADSEVDGKASDPNDAGGQKNEPVADKGDEKPTEMESRLRGSADTRDVKSENVPTEHKAEPTEVLESSQVVKQTLEPENLKLRTASGAEELKTLQEWSQQLKSKATIKQNEGDMQGKSFARKYSKIDQAELNSLGLTPSLVPPTPSIIPAALQTMASFSSEAPVLLLSPKTSEIPITSLPKIASALPSSGISTELTSSIQTSALQVLPPPKLSYATALQASVPAAKRPADADAWAVKREEAWGAATGRSGEDTIGVGSSPSSAGSVNGGRSKAEMQKGSR